jgi:hypothetical protein
VKAPSGEIYEVAPGRSASLVPDTEIRFSDGPAESGRIAV